MPIGTGAQVILLLPATLCVKDTHYPQRYLAIHRNSNGRCYTKKSLKSINVPAAYDTNTFNQLDAHSTSQLCCYKLGAVQLKTCLTTQKPDTIYQTETIPSMEAQD